VIAINNKILKTLRIKFEKAGPAKYISHLDLNRLFARSLARAGVAVAHSEGFNPRPKIVFASTLALGLESFCEYADIKITDAQCGPAQIFGKIINAFPQGINILEIYEPETGFDIIDKTKFKIFINITPGEDFSAQKIAGLLESGVTVEKKPGINVNLKDYIDCICGFDINGGESDVIFEIILKTNREMFLNPENIIKGINTKYKTSGHSIQKTEMYDKTGKIFK